MNIDRIIAIIGLVIGIMFSLIPEIVSKLKQKYALWIRLYISGMVITSSILLISGKRNIAIIIFIALLLLFFIILVLIWKLKILRTIYVKLLCCSIEKIINRQ